MAATDGSTRVVYAAPAGNVAIAVAKLAAYGISRSSAMLTEAIHSLVDSTDQVLLLIGQSRGRRPADPGHPLGHGMETYFWSLIVAVMVLLLGGGASLYQGVRHLLAPEPIESAALVSPCSASLHVGDDADRPAPGDSRAHRGAETGRRTDRLPLCPPRARLNRSRRAVGTE